MKKYFYLLLLLPLSCMSESEYTCGSISLTLNGGTYKKSEYQFDWSEKYSCEFELAADNKTKITMVYEQINLESVKENSKFIESAISEFYVKEKNIYRNQIYKKNINTLTLRCFNELIEDAEEMQAKCFVFKNNKKFQIFFNNPKDVKLLTNVFEKEQI